MEGNGNGRKKRRKRIIIWSSIAVVVLALVVTGVVIASTGNNKIDPSKLAKVERGDLAKSVVATGNFAGNNGGGMEIENTPVFHVSGGSFTGNDSNEGGGIMAYNSTGSILNVTISGNVAKTEGGGVYNGGFAPGAVTLQVAKVTGNGAPAHPDVAGPFTYV